MKTKVALIRCENYDEVLVERKVREAIDLLGGIKSFVKPGQSTLVKPNLLSAKEPEAGIDTHPAVVRAIVRLAKEAGGRVSVGDSPGGSVKKTADVYEKSGMRKLCDRERVRLVRFEQAEKIKGIPISTFAREQDVLISVPKFKTHELVVFTGAVKNMFGVVPGLFKTECHKLAPDMNDFSSLLVDIFRSVQPHLSVMDGVVAMEGEGPGSNGTLRRLGLILASEDAVAMDAVCARIMGISPDEVPTTRIARERGLGTGELTDIEVVGEDLAQVKVESFKLPRTTPLRKIPRPLLRLGARLVRFRVAVDKGKCSRCRLCLEGCPVKAITLRNGFPKVSHKECILCLCCFEFCPEGAISVKKSLLARLF